jgi:L-iditol 2-dehydrogenase
MKAAVYRGQNDLRVEEVPVPVSGDGELLIRVDACGVCPTDIKKIQKGTLPPPLIFGHEIAGTVAKVGAGVARYREGDRVVVHHHAPCGTCFYCRKHSYAQCPFFKTNGTTAGFEPSGGGMAEYIRAMDFIVERGTIRVPEGVLAEEAVFVEPVNTCLKAVQKARIEKGETVLVVGQGPIGLLLLQLARWAGAETLSSDTMPDRLAISRSLGAQVALDATAVDVPREVRALTEGRGADCTLLAAVGPQAFAQAVDATRPGGRVMVFSATSAGETAVVELGLLCMAEKEILTSYSSSADIQDLSAQLVFGREIQVRPLVTHQIPLARAKEAIDLAAHPTPGVLKVVVRMTEPGAGPSL